MPPLPWWRGLRAAARRLRARRRPAATRPSLEGLESRCLLAVGFTEFTTGLSPGSQPILITSGPDGNLWFTEQGVNKIGRITPAGVITEFPLAASSGPSGITTGPDGNLWFTERSAN